MVNVGTAADPILTRLVEEDKVPWYKKPNLRILYVWLFFCCMGVEMTSGFDSQLINTLQYSQTFHHYLGGGRMDDKGKYAIEPGLLGFVNSCYQLGSIFAVPVAPWFAQKYGRRWSIMLGSLIMVVGALIQGFAQHVGMYIVARMILGAGILFCIISGAALIGELGYPKERATLTSLFNSSYFIGQITASAIAMGTTSIKTNWAWRIPSLLQICPSLIQIATVFSLLPESPRFLISKDRTEEAAQVLIKYHAEGDQNSQLVQAEIVQIRETIKAEMEASKQSWLEVVRTAGMRRRFVVTIFIGLFTQLSGNTLMSYYSSKLFELMGYTSDWTKTRINLANACWNLMNATALALIVPRFKRRNMYMLSATLMLLVFIAITVSLQQIQSTPEGQSNNSAGIAALFFYFAYSPTYNIGNNALTYTYLVELWPYAMRSRGIGVQQIFGKLAGFFSTNVNSIALDAIQWKYLAIYCGWIFFEFCIVYWLYPETSGRTLEELAFLFEDDELKEKATAAVEKQIHFGDAKDEHQTQVQTKEVA
ncbi:unnamed protein product [Fusarium equiseti]|uniref:Major facilitator superfamily (MFS) profile domain-containing protein n=1 Tax=Fusarium equiseti TaxID=61235 RepID=A0A8J2ITH5_FUSEQ|nr:unnamed protein product [Fusarium equiseti]